MVSIQASSRHENLFLVHSLVLWKTGVTEESLSASPQDKYLSVPRFEMVSRFAEKMVAKKLSRETVAKLKSARHDLAPLSGAAMSLVSQITG